MAASKGRIYSSPSTPKKAEENALYFDSVNLSRNQEFLTVFLEYEGKQTPRAKICNDADQLECLMQALSYAKLYPAKRPLLEDFWHSAKAKLLTEPGKKMFGELWRQKISLAHPAEIPSPGL